MWHPACELRWIEVLKLSHTLEEHLLSNRQNDWSFLKSKPQPIITPEQKEEEENKKKKTNDREKISWEVEDGNV